MPLRIQITRQLTARSQRVKSVDIHPREPWILAALFDGNVYIWNYQTQALVKSFEIVDLPVRCAKFVAREGWFVCGSDDMELRAYNYNTMEKLKSWQAHSDYIRCIVVHPVQPYILSSSDDMTIKLWDWSKNWANTMIFEGHSHYAMQIAINPKDTNTFASASLDRTVKVWGFNSPTAHFTLEGHEKGVNCVEYALAGDKPYIVSGADDKTIKIWDYQNKTCVQTLEGHRHNVAMVCFHPVLPIIVSGSEDGTVKMWNANTYRLEKTLNYGMERVWCAGYLKGANVLALGYDEGTVMIKLGSDSPAMSMDNAGKVVWARHNEIQMVNVRSSSASVSDGEQLSLGRKDLGNTELFPQTLLHDPKGRFVVVCGDGEFVIYTALAWRNKAFGQALEFVWADGTGDYCVRESASKIKFFKNFKERHVLRPDYSAERIFGGTLLAVRSSSAITFYDWQKTRSIRKIEVCPKAVYWSDTGDQVALVCDKQFYVLQYNKDLVKAVLDAGAVPDEEGIEDAFEVLNEVSEVVDTGIWIGDCFVFTNKQNRLNYYVGGELFNIAHLERKMFLLGYLTKEGRVYLADKEMNIISYKLETAIINYQTAVLRGDMTAARKFLPKIPEDQRNRVAQFLESQGLKEEALHVSTDPDHRFDLAMALNNMGIAKEIAREAEHESKWKQLGDLALRNNEFELAEECMTLADDVGGLLLLHSSLSNADGIANLAAKAQALGKQNVAFVCHFLLQDVDACIDLLVDSNRVPEAAFFARTYRPSRMASMVSLWRAELSKTNPKAAESLADPTEYPNLFPQLEWALAAEKQFVDQNKKVPSSAYPDTVNDLDRNLIEEAQELGLSPVTPVADVAADVDEEPVVEEEIKQEESAPVQEEPVEPEPVAEPVVVETQAAPAVVEEPTSQPEEETQPQEEEAEEAEEIKQEEEAAVEEEIKQEEEQVDDEPAAEELVGEAPHQEEEEEEEKEEQAEDEIGFDDDGEDGWGETGGWGEEEEQPAESKND